MNTIQTWLLKHIARVIVVQGAEHKSNIIKFYAIIREAAEVEFYEDNVPTLNSFLVDCHERSLAKQDSTSTGNSYGK